MSEHIPAVSVIIPIYNVGEYLYRCLSSVACQTFKDYEVIMINDSSTDNSPEIAGDFAEKFTNFTLVHNPKKGVSSARNLGISISKGTYIAFVDSDDYIDPNYLLGLYKAVKDNDADVSHCNYVTYNIDSGFSHSVWFRKPKEGIMSNVDMVKKTVSDFFMRSYLWNKLWRKSLFTDNNITFPDMKFEDIATVSKLLYYANKGVIINKYLYYYTIRDGSIVQKPSIKSTNDYILSFGILRRFFIDKNETKKFKYEFIQLSYIMFLGCINNLCKYHFKNRNAKNFFKNIFYSQKNILYFFKKEFKNDHNGDVKLICPLIETEDKIH